jgi:hypothetical protein
VKRLAFCLLSLVFAPGCALAQIYSTTQLLQEGNKAYPSDCIRGSNYLFAYLQRDPKPLSWTQKADIEDKIAACTNDWAGNEGKFDESRAAAEKRCNAYAAVAVGQYHASEKTGCDDGQGGWHDDFDEHYQWCLTADPKVVMSETRRRQVYLNKCAH